MYRKAKTSRIARGTGGGFGGGMRGFAFRPAGLGIGGVLVLVVISYFLGIDPMSLLSGYSTAVGGEPTAGAPNAPAGFDAEATFSRKVLRDTEDTWTAIFQRSVWNIRSRPWCWNRRD